MYTEFITDRLKDFCQNSKEIAKKYDERNARTLIKRILEIQAAKSIHDLKMLPGPRCHKLNNDRGGQYAVDLVHPLRLVILPNYELGNEDERLLTKVTIIEIIDYH
jgi:proteic killer suppression protein